MRLRGAAWVLAAGIVFSSSYGEGPTGYFSLEERVFPRAPRLAGQVRQFNAALETEIGYQGKWARGLLFDLKGFMRLDENDPERNRVDLPGFQAGFRKDGWAFELGCSQVFWGVTESRHLVDVVNQTDWSGDLEGEEKLGQPMVRVSLDHSRTGLLEGLAMTGFRPRPFPGATGRPAFPYPIRDDNPVYESRLERWHPDFALRWSHHFLAFDWALSGFTGTSRDPRFLPELAGSSLRIRPFYENILQGGWELQYTSGSWLWKLEALARQGQGPYFTAVTGGLEYLVAGAWRVGDISFFLEYNQDTRRNGTLNHLDNDLFTGLRFASNLPSDARIEAGAFTDLEAGTVLGKVESSRRFGDVWLTKVELRLFSIQEEGFLAYFRRDHHMELELRRVF